MVLETMLYQLNSYGLSDIGHVRDNNEDVWLALPEHNFFILADGMGGHSAGEVAAEEAVASLSEFIMEMVDPATDTFGFDEAHGIIHFAFERTNTHVYEKSLSDPSLSGMGTTLCCLFFHPKGLVYGHVGDSRIYRFRKGHLEQLTEDHSLVKEMIDKGQLTQSEGNESNFKNIITRAIGTEVYIEPSVHMTEVEIGDYYIMCSDGLTDMLSQGEIEEIAKQYTSVELVGEALVAAAKDKGGKDNITVVVVEVYNE